MTLTPTLKVIPNGATCLDPTFHLGRGVYSEHDTNPNPKHCSKCYHKPRSNFSFEGGGGGCIPGLVLSAF